MRRSHSERTRMFHPPQVRAPVDHPALAVHHPLIMQRHERCRYCSRAWLIKREHAAPPIEASTQTRQLLVDAISVLAIPIPHLQHTPPRPTLD